jgi:glycosyltransferase involved in cell wall biosynthesis
VRDLVHAGVKGDFEVTVVCPTGGDLGAWVEAAGARWIPVQLHRQPHPCDLVHVLKLRSLARLADVVHLHSSKAGALGRLALATLGRRRPACIFTPHGWSWLPGGVLGGVYRGFERLAAPLANVIVAVSPEEREAGARVLRASAARMQVIVNGVDLDHFVPGETTGQGSTHPLIVCVGRLCRAKGQDVAVEALALLAHQNARLRLVGEGPDRLRLLAQARALGVGHRVELPGAVLDSAPEFRAADVVLVPSRWDGLSLALLEAMACGTTVVATRVPGSAALEGAGVLVAPGRPQQMADAIDALLANPARRAALGDATRQRAKERFSLDRSLDQVLALWAGCAR